MSHAVAATSLGLVARPAGRMPARFWVALASAATLPDADVVAFALHVPYGHMLGHRGLTHSLPCAALLAAVIVGVLFHDERWRRARPLLWAVFCAGAASHGVLDAMTTGGQGVAFFAPLSGVRYFFPWRPILVSPIGVGRFFSAYGVAVLRNEMVWVWLPSLALAAAGVVLRRRLSMATVSE